MLLPSMPSRRSSRQGQIANASGLGHGMCQKAITVAAGIDSRIMRGKSAK